MSKPNIPVVDFKGPAPQVIRNLLRGKGAESEIVSRHAEAHCFDNADALVLYGGAREPTYNEEIFLLDLPTLAVGICHPIMAYILGGDVGEPNVNEFGVAELKIIKKSSLLEGVVSGALVQLDHKFEVTELPEEYNSLARTKNCKIAAYECIEDKVYGLQFRPESKYTQVGSKILKNFINLAKD